MGTHKTETQLLVLVLYGGLANWVLKATAVLVSAANTGVRNIMPEVKL